MELTACRAARRRGGLHTQDVELKNWLQTRKEFSYSLWLPRLLQYNACVYTVNWPSDTEKRPQPHKAASSSSSHGSGGMKTRPFAAVLDGDSALNAAAAHAASCVYTHIHDAWHGVVV